MNAFKLKMSGLFTKRRSIELAFDSIGLGLSCNYFLKNKNNLFISIFYYDVTNSGNKHSIIILITFMYTCLHREKTRNNNKPPDHKKLEKTQRIYLSFFAYHTVDQTPVLLGIAPKCV